MSPSQYNAKKEITSTTTTNNNNINGLLPLSLKINKDSHLIKKSSSSSPPPPLSSSSSTSSSLLVNSMVASNKPPHQHQHQHQHRHPVIIYTHSPKVIHTHPKDFMALVQKLTGLSRSEDDNGSLKSKHEPSRDISRIIESDKKQMIMVRNEDNETSSVITEENNIGESQVNSCFVGAEPPILEPPVNPYLSNFPMLASNSSEFMCSSQPFLNYSDSFFFSNNIRTSIPSSATLEGMKEFRHIDYS